MWVTRAQISNEYGQSNIKTIYNDKNSRIEPTKQMLIGYMIEYIYENKKRYILETHVSVDENYLRLEDFINKL